MKSEKTKYFTIFSQRLAGYLMLSGFRLAEMRKDEKGTMKNIFFFVDSEELQKEIKNYKRGAQDGNKKIPNGDYKQQRK